MFDFIVGFIVLSLVVSQFKRILAIVKYSLGFVLGATAIALFGLQAMAGMILGSVFNLLKISKIALCLSCVVIVGISIRIGFWGWDEFFPPQSFSSLKYLVISVIFIVIAIKQREFEGVGRKSYGTKLFQKNRVIAYGTAYFAISTLMTSIFIDDISSFVSSITGFGIDSQIIWWAGVGYWGLACLASLAVYLLMSEMVKLYSGIESAFKEFDVVYVNELVDGLLTDSFDLTSQDVNFVIADYVALGVSEGNWVDLELANNSIAVFEKDNFDWLQGSVEDAIDDGFVFNKKELVKIVIESFSFKEVDAVYYVDNHLKTVGLYNFDDGRKYLAYVNSDLVKTCSCCGFTIETNEPTTEEWFCSDTCMETEDICLKIKEEPYESFLSSATSSGFIVMAGAKAWDNNHKIFATGGQGHGFAAENANNYIDKLSGKSASVIGGDNQKDGADRVVNGEFLQTKYCATGVRSVNAAFHGDGDYRYMDDNGQPMLLEVPKDQYEEAVYAFEKKIEDGKVPSVSDPEKAREIVVKGNITYDQARNITKFGTIESVTYDISEGVVVGLGSASISFGVTAAVYYFNTKDKNKAIKVATLQAGKTFGRTLSVYVATQQLHRLSGVQKALGVIDVSNLSPSFRLLLGDGLGAKSVSGINKALKGTVVTSAVLIAVSTGPDFLKMIQGRISGVQFLKNATVASSSVVGGTVGSIAGGALFSPFGPAGVIAGRVAGGMLGGALSAFFMNKVASKFIEGDNQKMLKVVKDQFEYLATTFMLTSEEVDNVNQNLEKVINADFLENMFANYERRHSIANFGMKPIFVSVVKQRGVLTIEPSDIVHVINDLAA